MANCNTFRLLFRLSVIIMTVSMNNNEVRNGVVAAASQLVLQPFWDIADNVNETNTCFVDEDVGEGTMLFKGSSDLPCSLQVTAPQGTYIGLQLHGNINRSTEDSFLYVERLGNLEVCLNKYLVFGKQQEGCMYILSHPNISVVMYGVANVFVSNIPSLEISQECPEFNTKRSDENISNTSNCYSIKGYTNKIACEQGLGLYCRLNFQIHRNCDAILGPREVTFRCNDFNPLQNQTNLIIYNHGITTLDLSGNGIVEINDDSFADLETLQSLSLQYNNLAILHASSFHGLFNLQILLLHNNVLHLLPEAVFHGLHKIKELHLYSNMIRTLPNQLFFGLDNLEILYLTQNQITNLTEGLFTELNRLRELILGVNMLASLPTRVFFNLTNLESLALYNNPITSLNRNWFSSLNKLKFLYITYNMLTSFDDGVFQDLVNLRELWGYGNNIRELTARSLQGLNNLHQLIMYNIRLQRITSGVFQNLTNLNVLWLGYNELSVLPDGVFHGLVNLELLHLNVNKLKRLNEGLLFGLNNLDTLDVGVNMLTTLPNHLFKRSKDIDNINIPNQLTSLIFENNSITAVPYGFFQDMHNLKLVALNGNNLTSLNPGLFQDLSSMNLLILSRNKLTNLVDGGFDGMINLEMLFLDSNKLKYLNTDAFRGIGNLRILYLSTNNLTQLSDDIFKHTIRLILIHLESNNLYQTPSIKYLSLKFINVRYNPLTLISHSSLSSLGNKSEVFASQHEICDCYVPPGVICEASDKRSPYLTCDRLLTNRVLAVIMWIMGANAFGGNLFVLIWRWYKKDEQSNKVNTMLLSNLAASDLLMGIYMLITASADLHFGDYFPMRSETWRSGIICRIAGVLAITASEASVFFVMLISIDRFICIRFPYSDKKIGEKSAAIIATIIWLTSFALGIIPSVLAQSGASFKFYDKSHVCIGLPLALTKSFSYKETSEHVRLEGLLYTYIRQSFETEPSGLVNGLYFAVAVFLGLNCICYLIILGCYVEIVRAVKKSSKQVGRNRDMKEQITLTLKVTAIVATDFFCWFPIIILGILVQVRVVELPASVYAWCVTFVLPINSAINPYLYTVSEIISNAKKKRSNKSKSSKNSKSCSSISTTTHSSKGSNTASAIINKHKKC